MDHGKALRFALWIAFIFMLVELVGGWIANSLALISDALHMFTDAGAITLGLIVVRIAKWPKTAQMSFGYHRAEVLGALASALSLWGLCGVLIYESIMRFIHPPVVNGPLVFVIAVIGLAANFAMLRVLHPKGSTCLTMHATYLHVLSDFLGSIGVILSGIIIWATQWNPIDPIITIIFSTALLYSSGKIVKNTVRILMQCSPEGMHPLDIEQSLKEIKGVKEVHDLHLFSISPTRHVLSVHLVAEHPVQVLKDAHTLLEEKYDIHHMTVQVEEPASFDPRFRYDRSKAERIL